MKNETGRVVQVAEGLPSKHKELQEKNGVEN
jgi:hypothetical protein